MIICSLGTVFIILSIYLCAFFQIKTWSHLGVRSCCSLICDWVIPNFLILYHTFLNYWITYFTIKWFSYGINLSIFRETKKYFGNSYLILDNQISNMNTVSINIHNVQNTHYITHKCLIHTHNKNILYTTFLNRKSYHD